MTFIDLNNHPLEMISLTKAGKYIIFFFNYSGNVNVQIKASNIDVAMLGLYVGINNDNFFLNTTQQHKQHSSISNLLVKGVFYDKAHFHYEGLIKIDKTGQKTHAYQKNQNIVMGKNVEVESSPFLEISANDVFCTHGSTTGKLPKEELHYLATRGISEERSEKLLISGFIEEVFSLMNNAQVDQNIIDDYRNQAYKLLH